MLQQLVQTLSTTSSPRRDPDDDEASSWLCSSFDLYCGLTVVEEPLEQGPAGFVDNSVTVNAGRHAPTQA